MTEQQKWFLFIDESGNFDDTDDPVSICGLLLRWPVPGLRHGELAQAIRSALPHVPWPPHTAHLRHPASQVVWFCADPDSFAQSDRTAVLARAAHMLRQTCAAELDAAVARVRSRRAVDFGSLTTLRTALCASPHWQQLNGFVHYDLAMFRRVLRGVAELPVESRNGIDIPAACLFSVRENPTGDASAPEEDRYLALLRVLLGRATSVVRRFPGEHTVRVVADSRWVRGADGAGQQDLDCGHMAEAIDSMTVFGDGQSAARLVAFNVQRWGYDVDPRLVLVDLLAFLTPRAPAPSLPLWQAEQLLTAQVYLPASSGRPRRSHLASGIFVDACMRSAMGSPDRRAAFLSCVVASGLPRWTIEQAQQWL